MSREFRFRALAVFVAGGLVVVLSGLGAAAAPGRGVPPPHPIVVTGTYSLINLPTVTVGTPVTGSTGVTDQDGNAGIDTWLCVPTLASPIGAGGKIVDFFCVFEKRWGENGQDRIQSVGIYHADLSNPIAPWQNGTVPVTGGTGLYCGMSGEIALNHAPGSSKYTWTIKYGPLAECS